MCYIKAQDIFPQEIIDLIQQYVDGIYIYIYLKKNIIERNGEKQLI